MSVINNNDGVIASDMFDIANQSSYTNDTKIDVALDVQPKDFTILSLNCQSLPAKIDKQLLPILRSAQYVCRRHGSEMTRILRFLNFIGIH